MPREENRRVVRDGLLPGKNSSFSRGMGTEVHGRNSVRIVSALVEKTWKGLVVCV